LFGEQHALLAGIGRHQARPLDRARDQLVQV
jgi:hypothetical protein